jgi:hypothetical protein
MVSGQGGITMTENRRVVGYNHHPNMSTEYNRFNGEYFSGADVRIYFGDAWIDEINNISFALQENVAPIFGFCSTTYDKVARGSRSIQGSFTINFKESYYLHSAIERLASKMKDDDGDGYYDSNGFSEDTYNDSATIEHLLSSNDKNFEKLADDFEKTLWGASDNESMTKSTEKRKKSSYFYGDGPLKDLGFNILITYGPQNQTDGWKVSETTHSITGVQLTGVSQVVGVDGKPIEEQYSFIAKDLDANVREI